MECTIVIKSARWQEDLRFLPHVWLFDMLTRTQHGETPFTAYTRRIGLVTLCSAHVAARDLVNQQFLAANLQVMMQHVSR